MTNIYLTWRIYTINVLLWIKDITFFYINSHPSMAIIHKKARVYETLEGIGNQILNSEKVLNLYFCSNDLHIKKHLVQNLLWSIVTGFGDWKHLKGRWGGPCTLWWLVVPQTSGEHSNKSIWRYWDDEIGCDKDPRYLQLKWFQRDLVAVLQTKGLENSNNTLKSKNLTLKGIEILYLFHRKKCR